jgi:hypothetical protein
MAGLSLDDREGTTMASNENITLDEIARDPLRVNSLSTDATRQLVAQLEMAQGALKARRILLSSEPHTLART